MPAQSSVDQTRIPIFTPVPRLSRAGFLGGAAIAAVAIGAYSCTFSVPLLLDDVTTIASNPSIRHWGSAFWSPPDTTSGGRPILNLSLAANYAVSGTEVWTYHVVNLAIHILAGLTLFGIARRALAPWTGPAATRMAWCAALLWTVHPLQTESVTYIVQRAESLMGLFYLLTLYCFIRGAEQARRSRYFWFALCATACLLGMGTKEVMVSAPLAALLYDRTFIAGSFREAWRRRWGVYTLLGATGLVLPFLVLSTHGRNGTSGFGIGVSLWAYGLTQFPAIVHYLRLSIWPHPLIFDYGTEWVPDFWAVLPSALAVIALIAAAAWALCRPGLGAKAAGFCGTWFFVILAPTSLVPGNRQTAAEHRMYLALIPVVLLLVTAAYRRLGRAALPLCLTLAVALLWGTFWRNEQYRSALDLWAQTAADCPGNPFAHNNLGIELARTPGHLDEAVAQYEEALRLKPDYPEAHNNLGSAWLDVPGRLEDAMAQYREALRLEPGYAEAHNNLGNALEKAPGLLNDLLAQQEYRQALRLKPDFAEAYFNLGNSLAKDPQRLNGAIALYEEALRLNPGLAGVHLNLGNALSTQGRKRDAIAHYEAALRLNPAYVEAHVNLGCVLEEFPDRLADAVLHYEEALRLKPDDAGVHVSAATALLKLPGGSDRARAHFQEALQLQPENTAARRALSEMGAPPH